MPFYVDPVNPITRLIAEIQWAEIRCQENKLTAQANTYASAEAYQLDQPLTSNVYYIPLDEQDELLQLIRAKVEAAVQANGQFTTAPILEDGLSNDTEGDSN